MDRFSNELKSKAANGETITVMDLERLIADAVARPLLQQEKEVLRARMSLLSNFPKHLYKKDSSVFFIYNEINCTLY